MKKIILILLFFIFTASFSYAAVDKTKINIKEAVSIASKSNLDILSSRLNIKIEENNIKIANKLQNPQLGVFYNFGKAGKGNPQQIGVSQTIEIGKRNSRKNLALSNYELSKNYSDYLEFDLRMDVREAYTNLLAKKSVLSIMKEQEKILNKMIAAAQVNQKKGVSGKIDTLQAQLLLNQIITEVSSADYEVRTALYEFNKVLNCPDKFYDTQEDFFTQDYKPLLIPAPNTKMPEFDNIASEAINNRYDIKIALQQIDVAKKELSAVLKQRIPDIEIQGGYSYQNPGQSENGSFKSGAYAAANLVNIPLLHTYTPEIKNAELKLEQANLNYSSVENKALNELRKTYEKFLTTQMRLKNYNEQLLSDSQELINVSRNGYLSGEIDLTTLITMEESYRMITVAHTYALADYYNAWNAFIREVNNEDFTIEEVETI